MEVDQKLMKFTDHLIDVIRLKFDQTPIWTCFPRIIDYKLSMMVNNILIYHMHLLYEPHTINFDFVDAAI